MTIPRTNLQYERNYLINEINEYIKRNFRRTPNEIIEKLETIEIYLDDHGTKTPEIKKKLSTDIKDIKDKYVIEPAEFKQLLNKLSVSPLALVQDQEQEQEQEQTYKEILSDLAYNYGCVIT